MTPLTRCLALLVTATIGITAFTPAALAEDSTPVKIEAIDDAPEIAVEDDPPTRRRDAKRSGHRRDQRQKLREKFDQDGDGKLDKSERAEMRKAIQGRRKQGREKKRELREKRREAAKSRFDRDGNGKLNRAERKGARKTYREKRREALEGRGRARELRGEGRSELRSERSDQGRMKRNGLDSRRDRLRKLRNQFDRDGDGVLDRKERREARRAVRNALRERRGGEGSPKPRGRRTDREDVRL
ncbi:MAG: hypothetical protein AAF488_18735 [Planctomycetota bacterium]